MRRVWASLLVSQYLLRKNKRSEKGLHSGMTPDYWPQGIVVEIKDVYYYQLVWLIDCMCLLFQSMFSALKFMHKSRHSKNK